jgi:hypothetical protein
VDESGTPNEVSGADKYDPLHRRRRFSWKVFLVAAVIVGGAVFFRHHISDTGFGIAMAVCAVVAIAIAAPSAFSESWLSESMPEVAKALNMDADTSETTQATARKSNETDAV